MGLFFFLAFLLLSYFSSAITRYSFNGEPINLNNGNTTKGISGVVVGKDEDNQIIVEERTFKDGLEVFVRKYEIDGSYQETHFNSKGNRHGSYLTFWGKGRRKEAAEYNDGQNTRWRKLWDENGNLKIEEYYQPKVKSVSGPGFARTFNKSGSLSDIQCGTDSPPKEFTAQCGFTKTSPRIEIQDSDGQVREERYYNLGILVKRVIFEAKKKLEEQVISDDFEVTSSYYPTGQLKFSYRKKRKVGGEGDEIGYYENGAMAYQIEWRNHQLQSYKSFFMNKQVSLELKVLKSVDGSKPEFEYKEFYDTGKISLEGQGQVSTRFTPGKWAGSSIKKLSYYIERSHGTQKKYFEDGKIEYESNYDSDGLPDGQQRLFWNNGSTRETNQFKAGVLVEKKEYDSDKNLILDRSFYPDGSIKELRK